MTVPISKMESILERYPSSPEHLIAALQDVQAEFNFVPQEALNAVCDHLEVPYSQGWAVTTFYKVFSLEPQGEHLIAVCAGTACHVRGGRNVYEKLRRDLGIEGEEGTTRDLRFSLTKVRCLGCCSMAPVVRVDEETHGYLNQRKVGKLIKAYGNGRRS